MKAILEYSIPEEADEFEMAMNAGAVGAALHEFSEHLRSLIKYPEGKVTKAQLDERERIRETFYEIMGEFLS